MSKEVLLVFQDCPYCAPREAWGKEQTKVAQENGIKVLPTHFNTPGAKGLILKAESRGVDAMPFFTDGERFSYNLIDFVDGKPKDSKTEEAAEPKPSRAKAKTAKAVKEEADGDNQED